MCECNIAFDNSKKFKCTQLQQDFKVHDSTGMKHNILLLPAIKKKRLEPFANLFLYSFHNYENSFNCV